MVNNFKRFLEREGKSKSTINVYEKCVNDYINWCNENNKLKKINKTDINNYGQFLKEVKGQKEKTVNVKLCILGTYVRFIRHISM